MISRRGALQSRFFIAVLMMGVGIMLVRVRHRLMMMQVCVDRAWGDWIRMLVLMMGVMDMFVLMIHFHMQVRVDVLLRKV